MPGHAVLAKPSQTKPCPPVLDDPLKMTDQGVIPDQSACHTEPCSAASFRARPSRAELCPSRPHLAALDDPLKMADQGAIPDQSARLTRIPPCPTLPNRALPRRAPPCCIGRLTENDWSGIAP